MTEQENRSERGIDLQMIHTDMFIEQLDGENLRAFVSKLSSDTRDDIKKVAEIVHNVLPEKLALIVTRLTEEPSGVHQEGELQVALNLISLKPGTLESLYIAIKEVERTEEEGK